MGGDARVRYQRIVKGRLGDVNLVSRLLVVEWLEKSAVRRRGGLYHRGSGQSCERLLWRAAKYTTRSLKLCR